MSIDAKLKRFLEMPYERSPKWLDDHQVVFLRHDQSGDHIWKVNLQTKQRTRLLEEEVRTWSLHCHSSSGTLFYAMDRTGSECEQIYRLDASGKAMNLTEAEGVRHLFGGIATDGSYIAYACNQRKRETFDIWKMDLATGEKHLVQEFQDNYNWPPEAGMSFDGRYLLYNKLKGESDNALWMTDLHTGESYRIPEDDRISAETQPAWKHSGDAFYLLSDRDSDFINVWRYDLTAKKMELCYEYGWDAQSMCLSSDDKYLAVFVNADGYTDIHIYDLETNHEVAFHHPKGVYGSYQQPSWSPTGHRLLTTYESGRNPMGIVVIDLEKDGFTRITESEVTDGDRELLVEPELAHFQSFDGLTVPYWLYVPSGMDRKNMPILIEIHGGPEGQEIPVFDSFIQYLVSEGIAVVAPNVRGSTGYGKIYTHLDDVEKRLDSVKDIEYLVKHLVEMKIADPQRIAVSGTSYGGFMTLSCAARMPELWACAVDTVGMYDLVTFLENTADYRRPHRESEYGSLAQHREILKAVSPVSKIQDIVAPIMIVQGRNDPRVPVTEAEQAVEALQNLGREVKYLCYDDEGHGIVKLKNRLDCYPQVAAFIKKHLNISCGAK